MLYLNISAHADAAIFHIYSRFFHFASVSVCMRVCVCDLVRLRMSVASFLFKLEFNAA